MQMHWWLYEGHRKWRCQDCGGTTDNPNKGVAAQATCPGKQGKKRK